MNNEEYNDGEGENPAAVFNNSEFFRDSLFSVSHARFYNHSSALTDVSIDSDLKSNHGIDHC